MGKQMFREIKGKGQHYSLLIASMVFCYRIYEYKIR